MSRDILLCLVVFHECTVAGIFPYTSGPVEYRQTTIGVFVNSNLCLHEVVAMLISGNLHDQIFVAHRIVIADDPFFLDTQRVSYIACKGDESRGFIRRRLRNLMSGNFGEGFIHRAFPI